MNRFTATRWQKLQHAERPWLLAGLVWLGVSAIVLLLAWGALRWTAGGRASRMGSQRPRLSRLSRRWRQPLRLGRCPALI